MILLSKLRELNARLGHTRLHVTLNDGSIFVGLYMEYTDAEDNEEGIASIDIEVSPDEPEYCLFENEIKDIAIK